LIGHAYCRHPGYVSDAVSDQLFEELFTMIQQEFAVC